MKSIISTVKGTREFYPEDMYARTWLANAIRKVSERYGYVEYDGPFLEKIELYAAKSGEELVKEQSFVFGDRGGDLITLRPELTLSLARMVAQRQGELIFPLRWWSFGPFWRYERPQRGRTREFFQWNIDLVGTSGPDVDAELIAICADFFREVGLQTGDVVIYVNNRRLMEDVISKAGITRNIREVFQILDKQEKMGPDTWRTYAIERGLSGEQVDNLTSNLADPDLWQKSEDLCRVFSSLEILGARDYAAYNSGIVRGLDYYTGTVWEAKERTQGGRSILGGGRYDNLVRDVGGDPLSGSGFAMGDVMVSVILREHGLLPQGTPPSTSVLVTVFDASAMDYSLALASELRQAGIKTAIYPEAARLQKQLKYADKIGARLALIAGPDEIAAGMVTIKDLKSGQQVQIKRGDIQATATAFLARMS